MEIQFTIDLVGSGGNAASLENVASLKNMATKDAVITDQHNLASTFRAPEKPPGRSSKNPGETGGGVGDQIGSGGDGGGLAPVTVIGPIVITGAALQHDDGTGGSLVMRPVVPGKQ